MENKIKKIAILKNRGWRGLAELYCLDKDSDVITTMIFSFSQEVWDDMQKGYIVIQDKDNYYVINFTDTAKLPKGQRSVLIKNFRADVVSIRKYSKDTWMKESYTIGDYQRIMNFIRNRNNHTTSDWNYIGIRVIPSI